MKELEEKKSEEALVLVQKKFDSWRFQNERDEARSLQRSGSLRRIKEEADSQDLLSVQSCISSTVDHLEEISLESSRKMQDEHELISEIAGMDMSGREEDAWRLETKVVSHGVEGVHVDPNGEGTHARRQVKNEFQKAKRSASRR